MAQNDEQMQVIGDLNNIYDPMRGMDFSGEFLRTEDMPLTGNPRDIISVTVGDAMGDILAGIWEAIYQRYGLSVWKGITGPKDSPVYSRYWLWVVHTPGRIPDMLYNFRVKKIKPFELNNPLPNVPFRYGVDIYLDIPLTTAVYQKTTI